MKAHVDCHGCEQRELDAERVVHYLQANDIGLTDSPNEADAIIYVTCAVDTTNEQQSLAGLERLFSEKKTGASMIVGGCLPSISPDKIKQFEIAGTFSPRTMDTLDTILAGSISMPMLKIPEPNRTRFDNAPEASLERTLSPREEYDRAKNGFKIKVNQGCLLDCAYCVIKAATARLASEPWEQIVWQFKAAVTKGEPTIMLMGGDSGAYGYDKGTRFHRLLLELISVSGNYELFVHDFNVNWLLRDFKGYQEVFDYNDEVHRLRIIDLPVQSGSDKILHAMKRPYHAQDVITGLQTIKSCHPSIGIGTHIIIGFPGEGEEDFQQTLRLLGQVDFDFVTAFAYSEHPNASSAKLPGKVAYSTIVERAERMRGFLGDKVKILGA